MPNIRRQVVTRVIAERVVFVVLALIVVTSAVARMEDAIDMETFEANT